MERLAHGETTFRIMEPLSRSVTRLAADFLRKVYRSAMQVEVMIRVSSAPIRG